MSQNSKSNTCLKNILSIRAIIIFTLVLGLTSACTTATYGNKFIADSEITDQYRFKVYIGGFQFAPPESKAEERIKEFMVGKDYTSYKIISRRFNALPSYYEFTVQFSK